VLVRSVLGKVLVVCANGAVVKPPVQLLRLQQVSRSALLVRFTSHVAAAQLLCVATAVALSP
jgi:hypothetical protein